MINSSIIFCHLVAFSSFAWDKCITLFKAVFFKPHHFSCLFATLSDLYSESVCFSAVTLSWCSLIGRRSVCTSWTRRSGSCWRERSSWAARGTWTSLSRCWRRWRKHEPWRKRQRSVKWSEVTYDQVWWPILGICALHLTHPKYTHRSEHTHTMNTHLEQWAAIYAAVPGEQLGVRCLAQGHLSLVLRVKRALYIHSPHLQFLPAWDSNPQPLDYESDSLTIRPRLPLVCGVKGHGGDIIVVLSASSRFFFISVCNITTIKRKNKFYIK